MINTHFILLFDLVGLLIVARGAWNLSGIYASANEEVWLRLICNFYVPADETQIWEFCFESVCHERKFLHINDILLNRCNILKVERLFNACVYVYWLNNRIFSRLIFCEDWNNVELRFIKIRNLENDLIVDVLKNIDYMIHIFL